MSNKRMFVVLSPATCRHNHSSTSSPEVSSPTSTSSQKTHSQNHQISEEQPPTKPQVDWNGSSTSSGASHLFKRLMAPGESPKGLGDSLAEAEDSLIKPGDSLVEDGDTFQKEKAKKGDEEASKIRKAGAIKAPGQNQELPFKILGVSHQEKKTETNFQRRMEKHKKKQKQKHENDPKKPKGKKEEKQIRKNKERKESPKTKEEKPRKTKEIVDPRENVRFEERESEEEETLNGRGLRPVSLKSIKKKIKETKGEALKESYHFWLKRIFFDEVALEPKSSEKFLNVLRSALAEPFSENGVTNHAWKVSWGYISKKLAKKLYNSKYHVLQEVYLLFGFDKNKDLAKESLKNYAKVLKSNEEDKNQADKRKEKAELRMKFNNGFKKGANMIKRTHEFLEKSKGISRWDQEKLKEEEFKEGLMDVLGNMPTKKQGENGQVKIIIDGEEAGFTNIHSLLSIIRKMERKEKENSQNNEKEENDGLLSAKKDQNQKNSMHEEQRKKGEMEEEYKEKPREREDDQGWQMNEEGSERSAESEKKKMKEEKKRKLAKKDFEILLQVKKFQEELQENQSDQGESTSKMDQKKQTKRKLRKLSEIHGEEEMNGEMGLSEIKTMLFNSIPSEI